MHESEFRERGLGSDALKLKYALIRSLFTLEGGEALEYP